MVETEASNAKLGIVDKLKLSLFFGVILIGLAFLSSTWGRSKIVEFMAWGKQNETEAVFAYIFIFAMGAILHLPEVVLAGGAGYMFSSFGVAVIATVVGATIGAALAWVVGRCLLRETVEKHVLPKFPTLAVIDRVCSQFLSS